MAGSSKRYAVVTGSNKGIGFAICKLLASKGIVVVLTARDEKRGLEAVDKLKQEPGLSDHVFFHQLDVSDPASVSSLADFIKRQFGKLDILVNNAAVLGCIVDVNALRAAGLGKEQLKWSEISTTTYELTEECININYYGAKRMVDALIGLLQLSDAPRIVNVSSGAGKLAFFPDGWAKNVFSNAQCLTEEKVDEVLKEFLKDSRQGSLGTKGWPASHSAYIVSKAALNAYTRILAAKYPAFRANCVCPGFVKTDMSHQLGYWTPEEGAEGPVNNAAVLGCIVDVNALRAAGMGKEQLKWSEISTTTYELTEECININYYGAKRMVDALIGLLQLSDAPRIVNVSSGAGKLADGWAKNVFSNAQCLTKEKVDEVMEEFLKDSRQGSLGTKGWPASHSAYIVSKAALNDYTRILAAKYPAFRANCVCPGFVKMDMSHQLGYWTPEEGAEGPVSLSLLPDDGHISTTRHKLTPLQAAD